MVSVNALQTSNDPDDGSEETSPEVSSSKAHKMTVRLPKSTYATFVHFRKPENPLFTESLIASELVNDGLRYRGFTYDAKSETWVKKK